MPAITDPFSKQEEQEKIVSDCFSGEHHRQQCLSLLLGCQTQSESVFNFVVFFIFRFLFFIFFSVSVKVLPVTPLLSGVFVHRAFYAYFLRIERVVGNA